MLTRLLLPITLLMVAGGKAIAQNCTDVIALSRISSTTIQDKATLDAHATAFCNEYSSVVATSRTRRFSMAYEALAGSSGSSRASEAAVASRYCSATQTSVASADAYRSYVETIAPGAYTAYEKCVGFSQGGIRFDLSQSGVLPTEFVVSASLTSNVFGTTAELAYTPSTGITCRWNGLNRPRVTLAAGQTAGLRCQRRSASSAGYVQIYRTDGTETIVLPWGAYDDNGLPLNLLNQIQIRYEQLITSLQSSVVAFESNACPTGWDEYELAYGRFIRGIDRRGSTDPDSTRAPGSLQTDTMGAHSHRIMVPTNLSGEPDGGGDSGPHAYWRGNRAGEMNADTRPAGGAETRPKNVALLYCRRR